MKKIIISLALLNALDTVTVSPAKSTANTSTNSSAKPAAKSTASSHPAAKQTIYTGSKGNSNSYKFSITLPKPYVSPDKKITIAKLNFTPIAQTTTSKSSSQTPLSAVTVTACDNQGLFLGYGNLQSNATSCILAKGASTSPHPNSFATVSFDMNGATMQTMLVAKTPPTAASIGTINITPITPSSTSSK